MKREAAAARGEPKPTVGRPPACTSVESSNESSRGAQKQLRARAANTKLGYGEAKKLQANVREARQAMVQHRLDLGELQYVFWTNGVVNGRAASAATWLLRAAHLPVFATLAKKVYAKKGGEHRA